MISGVEIDMIKNIYETHLQVSDLDRSIEFYQSLGIELVHRVESRKIAFFFVGENRQMLGLWEVPNDRKVNKNHFAFGVELNDLLKANSWLRDRGIEPRGDFGKEAIEPLVLAWMPAASVYFNDPDGNSLELISFLEDEPQILDYVPYLSEWQVMQKKRN